MKFYKSKENNSYSIKIIINKLSALYCDSNIVNFCKNGKLHNDINASLISKNGYKEFYLNGEYYGNKNNFTKKSWRRRVKMQVFL